MANVEFCQYGCDVFEGEGFFSKAGHYYEISSGMDLAKYGQGG